MWYKRMVVAGSHPSVWPAFLEVISSCKSLVFFAVSTYPSPLTSQLSFLCLGGSMGSTT